jgi:phospholipid/cholesterol/gamma-HCH transport system permease protein
MMAIKYFIKFDPDVGQLICQGQWNIDNLVPIKKALENIVLPNKSKITIDGQTINTMDSAGAWLLTKWMTKLSAKKLQLQLHNFSDQHKKLLAYSNEKQATSESIPKIKILGWRARLGKYAIEQTQECYEFINFVGKLFFESLRILSNPKLWHWNTIASTINNTGTSALPIVALLSFMIGIVISYQMGDQLRNYGANMFIVNLLGLSVLREFGPLLTAILVAGRTGSAFTAQLGMMKINQEIDSLNTMGITPAEILLLPRILALFVVVPLLTIWADIFGVFGGMLMAKNMFSITWTEFLRQFQHEIPYRTLFIGLGKAPIFALVIASVACFQGMKVGGSAENVGARTTRSVVLSIFFIIIIDAILSVIFSKFKL